MDTENFDDDPKQVEAYYGNMFEMFKSEGWKQLVQAFEEQKEFVKDIETMNSSDGLEQLEHRKGRLVVINNILNLETVTHETYEYWLDESKND